MLYVVLRPMDTTIVLAVKVRGFGHARKHTASERANRRVRAYQVPVKSGFRLNALASEPNNVEIAFDRRRRLTAVSGTI